jgi:hypothetical protein
MTEVSTPARSSDMAAVCLSVCLRREALLIRVEVRDLHR